MPVTHFAIAAGRQPITFGTERQRMHHGAMRHARFVVKARLEQLRVGQLTCELFGGDVVNENLVGAGAGGEVAIRRERDGVNWIQSFRQRLPFDGPDDVR